MAALGQHQVTGTFCYQNQREFPKNLGTAKREGPLTVPHPNAKDISPLRSVKVNVKTIHAVAKGHPPQVYKKCGLCSIGVNIAPTACLPQCTGSSLNLLLIASNLGSGGLWGRADPWWWSLGSNSPLLNHISLPI